MLSLAFHASSAKDFLSNAYFQWTFWVLVIFTIAVCTLSLRQQPNTINAKPLTWYKRNNKKGQWKNANKTKIWLLLFSYFVCLCIWLILENSSVHNDMYMYYRRKAEKKQIIQFKCIILQFMMILAYVLRTICSDKRYIGQRSSKVICMLFVFLCIEWKQLRVWTVYRQNKRIFTLWATDYESRELRCNELMTWMRRTNFLGWND